jgi:excisionase family DNA binding protein
MLNKSNDALAVSIADAARMASLSRRSIENYITAKILPSVRIGRRRLIRVKDLNRFLSADKPSPRFSQAGHESQDLTREVLQ